MTAPVSEIAAPPLEYKSPLSQQAIGIVLAGIAAGLLSHDDWPGSIIAVVVGLPLLFLITAQHRHGWTRDAVLCVIYAAVAWIAVLIDPGPLNLLLLWLGCATFGLVGGGMSLSLPAGLLEAAVISVFRFLLPSKPKIDPGLKNVSIQKTNGWFALLLLPLVALTAFGLLLSIANPIIAEFVSQLSWTLPAKYLLSVSTPIALVACLGMGVLLRMEARAAKLAVNLATEKFKFVRFLGLAPVLITLVLVNAMFAVENALDYSYIWRGIALPPGTTFTSYVHRGSYSLIVTALLAALLMIVIFRRGTDTQTSRWARWLVYLFALQNVLLVASSAKRTLAYVDASGMTMWRLSALVWMGLVAFGLLLIAVRVWRNRPTQWLLNSNLAAAALVLLGSGLTDYEGIVARWNVERAIAKGGATNIDLDYNFSLGLHALPALSDLDARAGLPSETIFLQSQHAWNQVYMTPQTALRMLEHDFSATQASPVTFTLRNWIISKETSN